MIEKISLFCRDFRIKTLNIKLVDFCEITNTNIKNVSAFENGRANNILYLTLYYDVANETQKEEFLKGVFKCL